MNQSIVMGIFLFKKMKQRFRKRNLPKFITLKYLRVPQKKSFHKEHLSQKQNQYKIKNNKTNRINNKLEINRQKKLKELNVRKKKS